MRLDIQFKLKDNPNYIIFLRNNSYWYKILTRNPERINDFISEFKKYNSTIRTNKIINTINYLEMLSSIMSTLK